MKNTRTWFALSAIIALAAAVAYFLWPNSEDESDQDLEEGLEKS